MFLLHLMYLCLTCSMVEPQIWTRYQQEKIFSWCFEGICFCKVHVYSTEL